MNEINQLSTHVIRKDRRMEDKLEDKLEYWGACRRERIKELDTPIKTPSKRMEEMQPDKIKIIPPSIYYIENGKRKKYPQWYCQYVYDLKNMWKKQTQISTYSTMGHIPRYMPHLTYTKLNRLIGQLSPKYQQILICRYELQMDHTAYTREYHKSKQTYYRFIGDAKQLLKILMKA